MPVPPPYREALKFVAGVSDEDVEAIEAGLAEYPARLTTSILGARLQEALPAVDEEKSARIVEALVSLAAQQAYSSLSPTELATRVARSSDLGLPKEQQDPAARRLERLIDIEAVRVASKANDMFTEHDRVFAGARLFTDIRPVFGEVATEAPVGAVIVGMLKLEYITEARQRDAVFLALDQTDLKELKAVVDRGLEKMETLTNFLASTDLAYWEYEDEVTDAASN